MKQKRKVKSLISLKDESNVLLTVLLFLLGGILCFGAISLFTSSVGVEAAGSEEVRYEGIDDQVEVIFDLSITPKDDLTNVVNEMYLTTGGTFHMSGNVINNSLSGDYSLSGNVYLLGGENMNIASDNITIIGGRNNKVFEDNPNTAILGGDGNMINKGGAKNAATLIGGHNNKIGENQDSSAIIGGQNNEIKDNVVNSYILGGESNVISDGVRNVIVGGKGVTVDGISDVFAFSDGSSFNPQSPNAFYLYVAKGLGLGISSIYGGVESKGPVSFGEIGTEPCTNENIGVQGSLDGCLVGCTRAGVDTGHKWELIDHGDYCENVCKGKPDICTVYVPEPEPKPSYTSKCTVGNVDTGHAFQCASNLLDNYKDVVFETYLIDSEGRCPDPNSDEGQDKCAFMCESDYHLVGGKCYADCETEWGEVIKHGQTRTAYNAEVVKCSNDGYIFPENTYIINKPSTVWQTGKISGGKVKSGYKKSPETCGGRDGNTGAYPDYEHKKTIVCHDGVLYLAKADGTKSDTKADGGIGKNYKYQTCTNESYSCNTSVYNLTESQINDRDQRVNFNRDKDRGQGTNGDRGVYELCLDWIANPTNNAVCQKGAQHYKLVSCKAGYATGDTHPFECKKKCDFDNKSGDNGYKHGTEITAYMEESVACPGKCSATQLTCDDGTWIGDYEHFTEDNCVQTEEKCEGYGVDASIWGNHNNIDSTYEACEKLKGNGNKVEDCINNGMAYKLAGCIGETHHNDNRTFCTSNYDRHSCDPTGVIPGYGERVDVVMVTRRWEGRWDNGSWVTPKCGTKCDDFNGYHGNVGACEADCPVISCGEFTESSKPSDSRRKYDECTVRDKYCIYGETRYKWLNECESPYEWNSTLGVCEEPVTCTENLCGGHTESSKPSDSRRKYKECTIEYSDCTSGPTKYQWLNECESPYVWNSTLGVCEEPSNPTYSCGEKPTGDGYLFGESSYTPASYTPNTWTHVDKDASDLYPCEFTCDAASNYIWDANANICKQPTSSSCSETQANKCIVNGSTVDGTPISHTDNEYIWSCGEGENTTECGLCDENSPLAGQVPNNLGEGLCVGNTSKTVFISCSKTSSNAYAPTWTQFPHNPQGWNIDDTVTLTLSEAVPTAVTAYLTYDAETMYSQSDAGSEIFSFAANSLTATRTLSIAHDNGCCKLSPSSNGCSYGGYALPRNWHVGAQSVTIGNVEYNFVEGNNNCGDDDYSSAYSQFCPSCTTKDGKTYGVGETPNLWTSASPTCPQQCQSVSVDCINGNFVDGNGNTLTNLYADCNTVSQSSCGSAADGWKTTKPGDEYIYDTCTYSAANGKTCTTTAMYKSYGCIDGYEWYSAYQNNYQCVPYQDIVVQVANPAGANSSMPGWYTKNVSLWVHSGSMSYKASDSSNCLMIGLAGDYCNFKVPQSAFGKQGYIQCDYDKGSNGYIYGATSWDFTIGAGLAAVPCPIYD